MLPHSARSAARPVADASPTVLVLSAMTLRAANLTDRVRAASAAGFRAIGLRLDDYARARASGWRDADIRALLSDHAVRVTEVELLRSWGDPGRPHAAEEEDLVFHMARTLGSRHVNAGVPDGPATTDLARAYARLCRRAATDGLSVPLEFMPYGAVRSLEQALTIVRAAEQPNGGLLIDTWHCHRTGLRPSALGGDVAEQVISLQISDVQPHPGADPRTEARHQRRLPGEGVADIEGVLRTLLGRVPSVAVEVMSDALDATAPTEVAARAYAAARRALADAGWAPAATPPPPGSGLVPDPD